MFNVFVWLLFLVSTVTAAMWSLHVFRCSIYKTNVAIAVNCAVESFHLPVSVSDMLSFQRSRIFSVNIVSS